MRHPTVNGTRVMNPEFSNMGLQLAGGSGIEEPDTLSKAASTIKTDDPILAGHNPGR